MEKKRCSGCGKVKDLKYFSNNAKTEDLKMPFCKECWFRYQMYNKFDKHLVVHRLWRELLSKVPDQDLGKREVMMNKDTFEKWCYTGDIDHLITVCKGKKESECFDLHVKIRDAGKPITFDNIFLTVGSGTTEINKSKIRDW